LAVLAKEKGWEVDGLDIDTRKVESINKGISPIANDEELQNRLKMYPIAASIDPRIVADSSVIVIAVPTPVTSDNRPDLTPVISAVESILPYLQDGQLISVESTINPGVMDEVVMPLLRSRENLKVEVVHCPERINPGDKKWSVRNVPRVVGGFSKEGVDQAVAFYSSILEADIMPMQTVTEAEAVKILENTFRDINIAFINEMAKSFDRLGIDITNVIKGASTKPFAFMPHYPGCGVGGHCISVDPYYMIKRAADVGFNHRFLKLARQINNSMPAYTTSLLEEGWKHVKHPENRTVALLGLSYKRDVADLRNSPAFDILRLLKRRKFSVRVFDPYVAKKSTVKSLAEALQGATAIVLACDHAVLVKELTPENLKKAGVELVVDGRNALPAAELTAQSILYYGIGRSHLPQESA
jgi:nucleotide sugar dehydrogenase